MSLVTRRAALGGFGGITAATLFMPCARAAQTTFALVQINQQALFFNQMSAGA